MHFTGKIVTVSVALMATVLAPSAMAGGAAVITYSPLVTSIPTLSGNLLIVLALLMAAVAFRLLRAQSRSGARLLVWATAVGALATGVSGVKLISEAEALGSYNEPVSLDDATGGSKVINPGLTTATNDTDVTMSVKVEPLGDCEIIPSLLNGGGNGGFNGGFNGGANGGAVINGGAPELFKGDCGVTPLAQMEFCQVFVSCPDENGGAI